jgi:hypothetical protein
MLSDIVLTLLRRPVASSEAHDLLHQVMCEVVYRHITMAIKMASREGVFFHCHLFACCLGGRRGDAEQVLDRWQRPGASSAALDLLYWAMPRVLLQRVRMIKMACDGGTYICCHQLFLFAVNIDERPCYSEFKLTL